MEILIKCQNYNDAVRFLLEQKETEWETFSKYLHIPLLEKTFIDMIHQENEIKILNYIFIKLWNEYKKAKSLNASGNIKKDKLFSILVELLESKLQKPGNKYFIYMLIIVYIEGLKIDYLTFNEKLNTLIKQKVSCFKIDDFILEILKNEGFEEKYKFYLTKFLKDESNSHLCFKNFFTNQKKIKVPTGWKINEL